MEREIQNHRCLMHPHIVQFKEVRYGDGLARSCVASCQQRLVARSIVLTTGPAVLSPQAFLTPQYLAIAMEYASGGDMFEHVVRKGGLKENEARWFFQQLIVGVDYVHKMVRPPPARPAVRCWLCWAPPPPRGMLSDTS